MSSESEKPFHRVAAVGDVPLGCGIQVTIDHNDIALFNVGGEFFAIDDLCPHRGAALTRRSAKRRFFGSRQGLLPAALF